MEVNEAATILKIEKNPNKSLQISKKPKYYALTMTLTSYIRS